MTNCHELIAFFELKRAELLVVADDIVMVTASGERKLTEWSVTA